MTVQYIDGQQPVSIADVDRLERLIGRSLPIDYRQHLARQDGGFVESNSMALHSVFGLSDDAKYSTNIWKRLAVFRNRVPDWLLPVAQDVYGNLFAISTRDDDFGSVWFWDHEEESDEGEPASEDNITLVSSNWNEFFEGLEPVADAEDA
jgi:hypothetical protein